MADLKKCDICGDTYEGCVDRWLSGMRSSHICVADYGTYGNDDYSYRTYEMCPCCMTRVKNYIDSMISENKESLVNTTTRGKRRWFSLT